MWTLKTNPSFRYGSKPLQRLATAIVYALVVAAAGCSGSSGQPKPKAAMADEGQALFGSTRSTPAAEEGGAKPVSTAGPRVTTAATTFPADGWSIVIMAYKGDDRDALARQALYKVQTQGGLPQAYIEQRGDAAVVTYGRYTTPEDKRAVEDLARIREFESSGSKPFASAFLAPPVGTIGTRPEYDLRQARAIQGDWALYTLQIGFYGIARGDRAVPTQKDREEWRKFAEEAVTQLRREGELAFYYHGPNGSAVTIGIFGKDDFDPQEPGVESPVIRTLRLRYPYNLLNGKAVRERMPGLPKDDPKAYRLQPSGLVAIPSTR